MKLNKIGNYLCRTTGLCGTGRFLRGALGPGSGSPGWPAGRSWGPGETLALLGSADNEARVEEPPVFSKGAPLGEVAFCQVRGCSWSPQVRVACTCIRAGAPWFSRNVTTPQVQIVGSHLKNTNSRPLLKNQETCEPGPVSSIQSSTQLGLTLPSLTRCEALAPQATVIASRDVRRGRDEVPL